MGNHHDARTRRKREKGDGEEQEYELSRSEELAATKTHRACVVVTHRRSAVGITVDGGALQQEEVQEAVQSNHIAER